MNATTKKTSDELEQGMTGQCRANAAHEAIGGATPLIGTRAAHLSRLRAKVQASLAEGGHGNDDDLDQELEATAAELRAAGF